MPTIVFATPKGGAGKTTSSLLLATEFAELGYTTTLIDADPNKPLKKWRDIAAQEGRVPQLLTIISDVTADDVMQRIQEAAQKTQLVIVDLEGTASTTVSHAISQADFVIIPTQGSALDADEANRAVHLVESLQLGAQKWKPGHKIPYALLLTRINAAIKTRNSQAIRNDMQQEGRPVLKTELVDREAFRSLFTFCAPLRAMSSAEVGGLDKAIANSRAFAIEVIELLSATTTAPAETQATEEVA